MLHETTFATKNFVSPTVRDDLEHSMKNSGNNVAGFWIAFNRYFEDLLAVTIFDVISEFTVLYKKVAYKVY